MTMIVNAPRTSCPHNVVDDICFDCTFDSAKWEVARDGSWIEVRDTMANKSQIFAGSGHAAHALVTVHNAAMEMAAECLKMPQNIAAKTALRALAALLEEHQELSKHTHGFADPDCSECSRKKAIERLLNLKGQ